MSPTGVILSDVQAQTINISGIAVGLSAAEVQELIQVTAAGAAPINDGAKSAQRGALLFTVIGLFQLATAFSTTDEDLLRNRAFTIHQLAAAAVPVMFAFGLAPAVFVAAHFNTLIRYDMLAANVRQFRENLMGLAPEKLDREQRRQLLTNVALTQHSCRQTQSDVPI